MFLNNEEGFMKITYTAKKIDGMYHVLVWAGTYVHRFYRVKTKSDIKALARVYL